MNRPTEAEIAREARRVLRLLAEKGAHLAPARGGAFAVKTGTQQRIAKVRGAVCAEFIRNGWLTAGPVPGSPGSYVLSDAGAGWLARALNPHAPFAAQHRTLVTRLVTDDAGREQLAQVNEAESPLARLRARGLLSAAQFAAGERLRRDFTLGRMMPRLCADLAAPVVSGRRGADAAIFPDTVLAARQRFSRAMKAAGPGLSDLLFDVCCHLRGLETAEKALDWPRHSALVVLQLALDRLAAHYGLQPALARRRMRSWHAQEDQPGASLSR